MKHRIVKASLILVGSILSFTALFILFWAPAVSEMDDVLAMMIAGFPILMLALLAVLFLQRLCVRRLALALLITNSVAALFALFGGGKGIIDLITLQNRIYPGHQGNDYNSFHLAMLAVVPVLLVTTSWLLWRRSSQIGIESVKELEAT